MSDPADTVFLIDDDAGVLRALEPLLKAAGYGVRTYSSSWRAYGYWSG